jgi:phospholipase C
MLLGPSVTPVYSQESSELDTDFTTATPIKHVVIIFQENVSFDHYFATYPKAKNSAGEPVFHALSNTPTVNGLNTPGLLFQNPNQHNPFRLDRSQAVTCDQDHSYTDEQSTFDRGLMDKFVQFGTGSTPSSPCPDYGFGKSLTMGYYDGNTVTAMWNYAQHYAMNDNSFNTVFGPSTPGALNLISGQTFGVDPNHIKGDPFTAGDVLGRTVIGDPDPFYDDCGSPDQVALTGRNVGDMLNAKGSWGWFQGGFKPLPLPLAALPRCAAPTART